MSTSGFLPTGFSPRRIQEWEGEPSCYLPTCALREVALVSPLFVSPGLPAPSSQGFGRERLGLHRRTSEMLCVGLQTAVIQGRSL